MNEPSPEFEERLRRMQPRRMSVEMRDAVGLRLNSARARRDWPMRIAVGSGLAAACVIVAMLGQQTPVQGVRSIAAQPIVVPSPHDPSAIYAFNFGNSSMLNDDRRLR